MLCTLKFKRVLHFPLKWIYQTLFLCFSCHAIEHVYVQQLPRCAWGFFQFQIKKKHPGTTASNMILKTKNESTPYHILRPFSLKSVGKTNPGFLGDSTDGITQLRIRFREMPNCYRWGVLVAQKMLLLGVFVPCLCEEEGKLLFKKQKQKTIVIMPDHDSVGRSLLNKVNLFIDLFVSVPSHCKTLITSTDFCRRRKDSQYLYLDRKEIKLQLNTRGRFIELLGNGPS